MFTTPKSLRVITALVAACLLWSVPALAQNPTHGFVEVVFGTDMTRQVLDDLQRDMRVKGIELTYDSLRFDEVGRLQGLSIAVNTPGGSGTATMMQLQLGRDFGFRYDPANVSGARLRVGVLNLPDPATLKPMMDGRGGRNR
jgi:hypothetical protein